MEEQEKILKTVFLNDQKWRPTHEYLRIPSFWADQMMTSLSAPPEANMPKDGIEGAT